MDHHVERRVAGSGLLVRASVREAGFRIAVFPDAHGEGGLVGIGGRWKSR